MYPTASSVDRALSCPASQLYPQVSDSSEAAELGSERHLALDNAVTGFGVHNPAHDDWLSTIQQHHLDALGGHESEVTYRWAPSDMEGERLGHHLNRQYDAAPGYYGTADYVRIDATSVSVWDLKTGHSKLPRPGQHQQMRTLALLVSKTHNIDTVFVNILHATGIGESWVESDVLGPGDLAAIEADLVRLERNLIRTKAVIDAGRQPPLVTGKHCGYCKARLSCPAYTASIRAMAGISAADFKDLLTPETAALALSKFREAQAVLTDVNKALYVYAATTPIEVGEGRVWGPRKSNRKTIDAELGWPTLVTCLGDAGAMAAVTKKTSVAGIERGLKSIGRKKSESKEIMKQLEIGGAVTVSEHTEHTEYDKVEK